MAAIDVSLVRVEEHPPAAGRDRDVFDLELARCQERRGTARRGDGIEVRPAVLLPGKHDAVSVGPEKLVTRDDSSKDAAAPLFRAEDFARPAGRRVRDADRPGLALAVRPERLGLASRGDPHEGETFAVRRPHGVRIPIHARVNVRERLPGGIADTEEAVVAAAADEGETRPVRRPAESCLVPPRLQKLRRLLASFQGDRPDLVLDDVRDAVPLRGHGRGVALGQTPRGAARDRDDEDGLFGAFRPGERVRKLAAAVRAAAAHVDDAPPSGGESQVRDLLSVVFQVRGQALSPVVGRFSDPDVSSAPVGEDPGNRAAVRSRREIRGKGSAQHVFERKGRPGGRDSRRGQGHGHDYREADRPSDREHRHLQKPDCRLRRAAPEESI
jgi:hypothetical protein